MSLRIGWRFGLDARTSCTGSDEVHWMARGKNELSAYPRRGLERLRIGAANRHGNESNIYDRGSGAGTKGAALRPLTTMRSRRALQG